MRYLGLLVFFLIHHAHGADSCEMPANNQWLDFDSFIAGSNQELEFASCFVDVQALKNSTLNYQWVDIRPEQDFLSVHINGSINVPPHTLKTKTYLKQRPLLIIDHGASYRRLWRLCLELKQDGFSQVSILTGGINSALADGYPAHGVVNNIDLLAVSPKMAMEEFYLQGVLFVVLDEETQVLLSDKKIMSRLVRKKVNMPNFFSEIDRIRYQDDSSADSLRSIVVVDSSVDTNYGAVSNDKLFSNIYFMKGGASSLLKFLESAEWITYKRLTVPERFACKM